MNKRRDLSWLIAIVAIAAGFLIGLWAGSQWLPRLSGAEISDLTSDQQDEYVTLVALGYAQTGDQEQARKQLESLQAPNLGQLVAGVVERRAAAGAGVQELAALAQLATAFGVSNTMIAAYLPTATPPPTPTPVPPTPTPLPPTATPTSDIPTATPTATVAPVTATPTVPAQPVAVAIGEVNVRSGPGLTYAVISDMVPGEAALLIGRNQGGDWWQIQREDGSTGWVLGQLVTTEGDTTSIPISAAPPPPTATRVAVAPTPTALRPTPVVPKSTVDFVVKGVRLWGVQENGGYFDGPSLHCGEKQVLRVIVNDVNGQPLNGVTAVAWNQDLTEEHITGEKGSGTAEWVMSMEFNVRVARDVDGREVTNDTNPHLSKKPSDIPTEQLIQAGYCTDAASCNDLIATNACSGHYSWDVTFQRTY